MNVDYMKYFPYEQLRKNQKIMLDAVLDTINTKNTLMISAPTGTGKSSIVVPALACARALNKKVIIATRTKTQIGIFTNELERIRITKDPKLKYAYLMGKSELCPIYKKSRHIKVIDSETKEQKEKADRLYKLCSELKRQSKSKCDEFGNIINSENGCLFYQNMYESGNGKEMTTHAFSIAEYVANTHIEPEQYLSVVDPMLCPYEIALTAAKLSDVIIVNYKHIFDSDIRNALYKSLGIDESDVILIADEAHNVAQSVCESLTLSIPEKSLNDVIENVKSYSSMGEFIVKEFRDKLHEIGERLIATEIKKDKYSKHNNDTIYESVLNLSEMVQNKEIDINQVTVVLKSAIEHDKRISSNMNTEHKEGAMDDLLTFLNKLSYTSKDNSYIGIVSYKSGEYTYEIRNINPVRSMIDIHNSHHAMILISATLSPLNSYKTYLFGNDSTIRCLELDNIFPVENRKLYIITDYTSAFKHRGDFNNINNSLSYISKLCERKGNVAVFFSSYSERNKYVKLIEDFNVDIHGKEIFVEPQSPKTAREAYDLLNAFMDLPNHNKSGLMLASAGGKWSEGIDYKGDKLVGVMILGFPLAPYSTVQIAINGRFKKFYGQNGDFISYTLPALNKSMQALGRVIRTEMDKGLLILAEDRFNRYRRNLPSWVNTEAKLITIGDINDIQTEF